MLSKDLIRGDARKMAEVIVALLAPELCKHCREEPVGKITEILVGCLEGYEAQRDRMLLVQSPSEN